MNPLDAHTLDLLGLHTLSFLELLSELPRVPTLSSLEPLFPPSATHKTDRPPVTPPISEFNTPISFPATSAPTFLTQESSDKWEFSKALRVRLPPNQRSHPAPPHPFHLHSVIGCASWPLSHWEPFEDLSSSSTDQSELQGETCSRCRGGPDGEGQPWQLQEGDQTRISRGLDHLILMMLGGETEERTSSPILPQQEYRGRAVTPQTPARHRDAIETSLLKGAGIMLSSGTCSEGAVVSCPW